MARLALLSLLSWLVPTKAEAQTASEATQTMPVQPSSLMLGQMNGHPVFCFSDIPGDETTALQPGYCVAILPFPDSRNAASNEIQLFLNLQVPQNTTRISVPSPTVRPVTMPVPSSPPPQSSQPSTFEERQTTERIRQELEPLW
ncbi:hypothetical protein CKA32_000557 [Geitlerinema sp. FC II]|nr:hypothetical protein CKA32_000557 [Geitlerinema sp. FC II]